MAYGRVYRIPFIGVSVAATQDLISCLASSSKGIELLGFGCSQGTKFGDANETAMRLDLKVGLTTLGSGGTTPTFAQTNLGDAAPGFTAHVNDTTAASVGTLVTHESWYWDVRVPFQRIFTPEEVIAIQVSKGFQLNVPSVPATMTMSGYAVVREVG